MTRYFIAANIWLIFAVLAILGRAHSTMPTSSFFSGPFIEDWIYNLIVFGLFAASAFCFILTWKTCKKP
jgi:hypothetical protein